MASKFEEALKQFEYTTKLLDGISDDCQKYANLLLVNSKQSEGCSSCCNEIVSDIKQIRLLVKNLRYRKEQLVAIKAQEKTSSETLNKREVKVNRKDTRTSSMEVLVYWEKVVDAQLADNAPKNLEEKQPPLLLKPLIKRRIKQFENKDTKRVSSTAEFFLDEADEMVESYEETIQEEEEKDEDYSNKNFKPRIVDVVVSIKLQENIQLL